MGLAQGHEGTATDVLCRRTLSKPEWHGITWASLSRSRCDRPRSGSAVAHKAHRARGGPYSKPERRGASRISSLPTHGRDDIERSTLLGLTFIDPSPRMPDSYRAGRTAD